MRTTTLEVAEFIFDINFVTKMKLIHMGVGEGASVKTVTGRGLCFEGYWTFIIYISTGFRIRTLEKYLIPDDELSNEYTGRGAFHVKLW